MGTRGYSAPEQFIDFAPVTGASDVYSVGMLIVYLLTGSQPDEALVGHDLATRTLAPDIAAQLGDLRDWVDQALSFYPQNRPFLTDLKIGPPAALAESRGKEEELRRQLR